MVLSRGKSWSSKRSKEGLAHGEQEGERLLKEGLAAAGLTPSDLEQLRANDRRKVAIARASWKQTTVS